MIKLQAEFNEGPMCVGEIIGEWIFYANIPLPKNRTIVTRSLRRELGGAALNVHWYLNQLDTSSRLLASIGQSDVESVLEAFPSLGGGGSELLVTGSDSDTLFTIVENQVHRSVYAMSDWPANFANKFLGVALRQQYLVLNGGRHADLRALYVRLAREAASRLLAFNPSYAIFEYSRRELHEIVGNTIFTCVNAEEYEFLKSALGPTAEKLLEAGQGRTLAITRGKDGVDVIKDGIVHRFSSLTYHDGIAIGAGDAFFAGFLHRMLSGVDIRECAAFGLMVAAIVVESGKVRAEIPERLRVSSANRH